MSASMSNITDYRIKSLPLSRRYWDSLHQKQKYDYTDEQTNNIQCISMLKTNVIMQYNQLVYTCILYCRFHYIVVIYMVSI